MNPYERWDDWEWERAAQEVGRERGFKPQREASPKGFSVKPNWGNLIRNWSGSQQRVLLAALFFLTVFFGAHSTDPFSQAVHSFYQAAMGSGNYYASLNGMAKEAMGLGGMKPQAVSVDAKMQGKFLPPLSGPVTAGFGEISKDGKGTIHNGIDIGSALGIPVVAPLQGVVAYVGEDIQLGRIVKLDLGDGWSCVLGNLGDVAVQKGGRVEQGDKIGTVGLSAPLKKPWLHFELRKNNQPVNPMPYLVQQAK